MLGEVFKSRPSDLNSLQPPTPPRGVCHGGEALPRIGYALALGVTGCSDRLIPVPVMHILGGQPHPPSRCLFGTLPTHVFRSTRQIRPFGKMNHWTDFLLPRVPWRIGK